MKLTDLTGRTLGQWTVLARHPENYRRTFARWHCRCECGTERVVLANSLLRGRSTGCGCKQYADLTARLTKHGQGRKGNETPEYRSWKAMKKRCSNPRDKNYADYGGRGISVCDAWAESFEAFFKHMGPRPARHSLDRIDPNGNYEPGNCRWACAQVQVENRRPFVQPGRVGSASNFAKLTAQDVSEIRGLSGSMSQRAIGTKFGVTQGCISQIVRGVTWSSEAAR